MAILVVQSKVAASSLSGSLSSATTAGNCVVTVVNAAASGGTPSVSGVTLGGTADNFAQAVSAGVSGGRLAAIWADPGCSGGQTVVAVSGTHMAVNSALGITILEVSGLAATAVVDQTSFGSGTFATAWSSGTTGTTALASEFWIGADTVSSTATQPGSPWTNFSYGSNNNGGGYQIVSSTGTAIYNGTLTLGTWSAVVATLKSSSAIALPAAQVSVAAYLTEAAPAPQLPVAQVTVTAYQVGRGTLVSLPAAQVSVAAYLSKAAPAPQPPAAQVTVTAYPPGPRLSVNLPVASVAVRAFSLVLPVVLPAAPVSIRAVAPFIGVPPSAMVLPVLFGSALGSGIYLPGTPGGAGGPGGPPAPGVSPISGLGSGWEVVVLGAPDYSTVLAVIPAKLVTGLQFVQQLAAAGSGTVTVNMDDIWWGPGWSLAPSGIPTTSNYFTCTAAQAASIEPGDTFSWSGRPGTVFTVTEVVPSGSTASVYFTPPVV